jgi:hypothetical protein
MSAPHIASTTTGLSLPVLNISKDRAEEQQTRSSRLVVRERKSSARAVTPRTVRGMLKTAVPALLVAANVVMFGAYLYSANNIQGLSYHLGQAQKELRNVQDDQRQLQVVMAEQAASIRSRQQVQESTGFVAVGTPEFIAGQPSSLTMR